MAQVGREGELMTRDAKSVPLARLECAHGERVSQAMEPRAWLARRSADTDFAYELGERPMDDGVGKRAAAGMNEYAVATRMRPEREVSTKPVIDGGMQRHEAALAEFGVANEE